MLSFGSKACIILSRHIVHWMSKFFKSKVPAGIIDQRQLSGKRMSLYNGSGVCFRALS